MKKHVHTKKVFIALFALITFYVKAQTLVTYTESFDGTTFPPSGWTNTVISGSNSWSRLTAGSYPSQSPHSGAGEADFNSFSVSGGVNALITPPFSLQFNTSGAAMSFWMYRDNGYNTTADKVDVYYNTTTSASTGTLLGTINRAIGLTPTVTANGWYQYNFTIPNTMTSSVSYIIFKATSAYGDDIYLDDVSWSGYPCNSTPTITASGGSNCPGQPFTLTPSGATSYTYASSSATVSGTSATVAPIVNTTYTISGTNTVGCVSLASGNAVVTVTPQQSPTLSIVASPTAFCIGGSSTLTVSGANTYTWTSPSSTSPTITVSPTISTVYTVTGTGTTVCNGVKTITVVVNPLPVIGITASSQTICSLSTVTLTASGATTYTYTSPTATVVPAAASSTFAPASGTTYTATGTNANGCVSSTVIAITTNTLPILTIAASSPSVCSASPVTYTTSGAVTYSYGAVVSPTVTYYPTSNTTYTVNGTNAAGCNSSQTVAVTTASLPVISITPSLTTVCVNTPVSFTASGASTYSLNNTALSGTGSGVVTPTALTSYNVSGSNANGCTSVSQFVVLTNPLPVISVSLSSATVCATSPVTLTASGANTYSWSTNGTNSITVVMPSSATVYTVTGTETTHGCTGTATVAVNTTPLPVITISPASATVCSRTQLSLAGSGAATYLWSNTSSNSSINLTPTVSAVYTLTGHDALGCTGTQTVGVTVNALPVISVAATKTLCVGEVASYTASGASTYVWAPENFSGATYTTVPQNATVYVYTVTGTDANNCVSKATTVLYADNCLGIKTNVFSGNAVSVYPNPSTGVFTAEFNFAGEKTVMITNIAGQVINQMTSSNTSETFNLSGMAQGVYFIKVSTKNSSGNYKIVIE